VWETSYLHVKGIRLTNLPQPHNPTTGYYGLLLFNDVTHSIFERVETDHIGGWGVTIGDRCSDLLFLNCDSHHNADPYSNEPPSGGDPYGGSDGFETGSHGADATTDITFKGCRAWSNSDDGWDLYTKSDTGAISPVTIEFSIAYTNGTLSNGTQNANGDRNGFKLGGESIAVNHIARNNLAYNNGKDGFTWNSNPGKITVTSNVSKNNAQRNFNFDGGTSVFSSNISCRSGSGTNDRIIGADKGNNTWWMGSNGAACSPYTASGFSWWFNADGSLGYKFQ